ncbi:MAG: hypothetical protein Kow0029_18170 [Candidatus Rifleibacteriota bacterium]
MTKTLCKAFLIIFLVLVSPVLFCQVADTEGLLVDIPEPPGARSELPSPVPMVYQFMGALMDGEFDVCLANFDVETFLAILFDRQLKRMTPEEYRELYSYQVQSQRNEFRFLAKVMNRVAKGAKISYSDPRYHKKVQSKIVIRLNTNRGKFEFVVYCRFQNEKWSVYDYVLNGQRLSKVFLEALQGVGVDNYVASLRPFYGERRGFRPIRNKDYDFSMLVPNDFQVRQNVSSALLASVGGFHGQFLLHVQAATYDEPQTLTQVGKAIKETLMPFSPRLYDQWKSELAGVEIGNVLFHFIKNKKVLYTHMVIIPLGKKLIVLNFYHGSLQLLKHMTNLREKMLETVALPKLEAMGGVLPGEIPDELTLSAGGNELGLDDGNEFGDSGDITLTPDNANSTAPSYNSNPADTNSSEIPPPSSEEESNMLTPDSYIEGGDSDYPEPPPPPPIDDDENMVTDDSGYPSDNEVPPPPPPGSYGDGSGTDDDFYPGPGDGSEVSF